MYGINFNGIHSYDDFRITIKDRDIGYPEKEKIKVKVPFSNVEYDFSYLYGDGTYSTRKLKYTFNVLDKHTVNTTERINVIETKLVNWLMNTKGKQKLYDDVTPGYYYLAEIEGGLSFDEMYNHGTLTVEFTSYPFMIAELEEGNDLWNPFNFELDVAQITDFTVNGSLEVTLLNVGTPSVSPKIEASSDMEIIKDDTMYNIRAGVTESDDLRLNSGENHLIINGNGTIKFIFYKELI